MVLTYLNVNGVAARVHGDKPLSPEGEAAMRKLIAAAQEKIEREVLYAGVKPPEPGVLTIEQITNRRNAERRAPWGHPFEIKITS